MTRSLVLIALLAIAAAAAVARSTLESTAGLRGEYVADRQWGRDTRNRVDRQISTAAIDRAWNNSPPQRFTARWSGYLVVARTGWFTFATTSDDGSGVTIDDFVVLTNGGNQTQTGRVRLLKGTHRVVVDYVQIGGAYDMSWTWEREGGAVSQVPTWALWTSPPSPSRVVAARLVDPIPVIALALFGLIALWAVWQREWLGHVAPPRIDWALVLILLFGAYFRLQHIQLPMAEKHSWRQITNADIARNFSEGSLNILYPQVSWGGPGDAYVGMEFPLLQWSAAVLLRWFGEHDVIYRGIAVAFSLATIVGLYGLGTCLWGRPVGRGAAFLYAISPSAIFFGRTFISDTPMVCFSVFGVWGFASYLQTGKRAALVWGTAAASLACMVKVPAVIIFAPIAYLAWSARRWALLRDRALLGGLTLVLLLTIAWYVHGDVLFHRTGLGQAIWHPSGGYSPDIMAAAGPALTVSHWSTLGQLRDPDFYRTILERIWTLHLTAVGSIVVIIAAATMWTIPKRGMIDLWFATVVLFILVTAEGNRYHEFHQLPLLLPAALYFGLAARPAFDGVLLRRVPYGLAVIASILVLGVVGIVGFRNSRAVPELFRPYALDVRPIILGHQIREAAPADALVITVEYDRYGGNSPILLYHARHRGWSFDAASITPGVIERLHTVYGARYFATLIWSVLEQQRPDVVAYLATHERLTIDGPRDAAIFSLK